MIHYLANGKIITTAATGRENSWEEKKYDQEEREMLFHHDSTPANTVAKLHEL